VSRQRRKAAQEIVGKPAADPGGPGRKAPRSGPALLLAIVLVATALRIIGLTSAPPGLHQDEAANAWNAWCLLRTGKDQVGAPWPVFYFRALGENRTPLFLYMLLPFQLVGGLNVWTTRLPNALGGVVCVLLVYYIGRRWFGAGVGLTAAGLIALCPWTIHQSRWGHEGAAVLLLTLLPIAAWTWAGLPLFEAPERRPAAGRALAAGLLTGVCCYGYPSVRLFLPVFFLFAALATAPGWLGLLHTKAGRGTALALAAGGAATFGPLLWVHLTDENIAKRAAFSWVWDPQDDLATRIAKVAARYPPHFGPDFLFLRGDLHPLTRIATGGQLSWYWLPLLLAGLVSLPARLRGAPAARTLLVWLLCYPAGDLLSAHEVWTSPGARESSAHCMRSFPGAGALALLSGMGSVWLAEQLRRVPRRAALGGGVAFALLVAGEAGRFVYHLFAIWPRTRTMYCGYHADLLEACRWLRPRLEQIDAVFCTVRGFNQPYIVTLVGLGYDPRRWLAEPRAVLPGSQWDTYLRYGKIHFMYGEFWNQRILELGRAAEPRRLVFLVRPGETQPGAPVRLIRDPAGQPALLILEGGPPDPDAPRDYSS